MSSCPEISYLQTNIRNAIWFAYKYSWNEACQMVKKDLGDDVEKGILEIRTLEVFNKNLEDFSAGNNKMYVDYFMNDIKEKFPLTTTVYQSAIWTITRKKYKEKNNLLTFREEDHVVSFRQWFHRLFEITSIKFLDNPILFDEFRDPQQQMSNTEKAKKIVDKAIIESIHACIKWDYISKAENGLLSLSMPAHTHAPKSSTVKGSNDINPNNNNNNFNYGAGASHTRSSGDNLLSFGSNSRQGYNNSSSSDIGHVGHSSHNTKSVIAKPIEPQVSLKQFESLKKECDQKLFENDKQNNRKWEKMIKQFEDVSNVLKNEVRKNENLMKDFFDLRQELDKSKDVIQMQQRKIGNLESVSKSTSTSTFERTPKNSDWNNLYTSGGSGASASSGSSSSRSNPSVNVGLSGQGYSGHHVNPNTSSLSSLSPPSSSTSISKMKSDPIADLINENFSVDETKNILSSISKSEKSDLPNSNGINANNIDELEVEKENSKKAQGYEDPKALSDELKKK